MAGKDANDHEGILPAKHKLWQVKFGWSGRARTDNLLINSQMQTTNCATDQRTWWEVCISGISYPTPKVIEPSCRWFLAVDSGTAHNRQFLLPKTGRDGHKCQRLIPVGPTPTTTSAISGLLLVKPRCC